MPTFRLRLALISFKWKISFKRPNRLLFNMCFQYRSLCKRSLLKNLSKITVRFWSIVKGRITDWCFVLKFLWSRFSPVGDKTSCERLFELLLEILEFLFAYVTLSQGLKPGVFVFRHVSRVEFLNLRRFLYTVNDACLYFLVSVSFSQWRLFSKYMLIPLFTFL